MLAPSPALVPNADPAADPVEETAAPAALEALATAGPATPGATVTLTAGLAGAVTVTPPLLELHEPAQIEDPPTPVP